MVGSLWGLGGSESAYGNQKNQVLPQQRFSRNVAMVKRDGRAAVLKEPLVLEAAGDAHRHTQVHSAQTA